MSEIEPIPDLDWHEVYLVWAYDAKQNDSECARLTGIPRRTIANHKMSEGWGDRYVEAHYGLSETDLNLAKVEIRSLAKEGIQRRLRSIILDQVPDRDPFTGDVKTDEAGRVVMKWRATDKDAVNAMRIVSEYALDSARHSDLSGPIPTSFTVHRAEVMSPEDQAIAILEDNAAAVNTRIRKGRRT